jgi:GNAT superfamily N-acetyltransferase
VPLQSLNKRQSQRISVRSVDRHRYELHWFARPAEVIAARYQQGAICFVAFHGDDAVGCLWLAPGRYFEDEVACCFQPEPSGEAAWDFDVYVRDDYRASRVFSYLWDAAFCWLRENGFQWTMSRIDAFNAASIRAHRRLGAQIVGHAFFVVLGGVQLSFFTSLPFVHLGLRQMSPPLLRVRPR